MEAPKATASGTIDTILWVIDKSPAVFPSQSFDSENRRGERNTECLPGLWSSQALDVISPGIKSEKIDTEHTRTQSPSRRALTYPCGLSVYIYCIYIRTSIHPPHARIQKQIQGTYVRTKPPSRQAFGHGCMGGCARGSPRCCVQPLASRHRLFRLQSMGHDFRWG